jgi:GNAT superfamily N-acetyltransferase
LVGLYRQVNFTQLYKIVCNIMKVSSSKIATVLYFLRIGAEAFVVSTHPHTRPQAAGSLPLASTATALVDWDIRTAHDEDLELVQDWIERKGKFDRSLTGKEPSGSWKAKTGDRLQSLFPEVPHGRVLFINQADEHLETSSPSSSIDEETVGFALYALRYAGFVPPLLWLEDLFVDPQLRSRGAGLALMNELATIAQSNRCTHMAWMADERNDRGIAFYERLGAKVTGQSGTCMNMEWIPDVWNGAAATNAAALAVAL